jgi:hypothetical protein
VSIHLQSLPVHRLLLQAAASDDAAQVCADNSVAALVQFLDHRFEDMRAAGVDLNGVMMTVLSSLPLCADTVEACNVHAWLVTALSPGGRLVGAVPPKSVAQLAQAILGAYHPHSPPPACRHRSSGCAFVFWGCLQHVLGSVQQ